MNKYTKVNVRRDIIELIKVKAAADGRSVTNYVERLLRADVNDLELDKPLANTDTANPQRELKRKGDKNGKND